MLYVPPRVVPTIKKLLDTSSPDHSADQGFVVFIERDDCLAQVNVLACRELNTSLEGVFHVGDCLVGVVIWGNSGDGVSIVCPDIDNYAVSVRTVLKQHLPLEGDL